MIIDKGKCMETRNTKQKEIILDILSRKENMVHPTIGELIRLVQKEDSRVGQATIYRNIKKLVHDGKIKKILTNDGYRYDINSTLHGHLICTKCHTIFDLYDENYLKLIAYLEEKNQVKIDETNIIFDGLCPKCKKQ